jgi:quercetin dioxygenase-like cupin family protein
VNILEKPEGTMANTQNAADGASRVELLRTEIPETDDRELVMSLLALAPGGTAPIHKHPGIGIGYVLEGVYESQYEGEPLKRFAAGEAIYDLQDKPHLIARNGSSTEPLRLIMTFVVRKGQPTILPL